MIEEIAEKVAALRPELDVTIGYLGHSSPRLAALPTTDAVVVPVLLSSGFHVSADIPEAAPEATVAAPIGPDPRIAAVVAERLRAAGWSGQTPVVLAAAGSSEADALDDVRTAAAQLSDLLGTAVSAAFVTGGEPRLDRVGAAAIASYVLAPGVFADRIAGRPVAIISEPIGADPLIAEVVLSRYDEAATG